MVEKNRHDNVNAPVLVHVITLLEFGGAQENTLLNCESSLEGGYEVHLISGCGGILEERAESMANLHCHYIPSLKRDIDPVKDLAALMSISRLLKKIKKRADRRPVIVHTHSSKAGILGRLGAFLSGTDLIVHTVHGFGFNPLQSVFKRKVLISLERAMSRVTDIFVLVSEENGEKGAKLGIFSKRKTELIRSGFDTGRFASASRSRGREKLGIHEEEFVAGMVACFKPQKGIGDFIEAARMIRENGHNIKFILVGDGELKPEIMESIISKGMGKSFILLGWRDDIDDVISSFDVLVLTSHWEGLPKVIPQAIISHVPVVATAVDGSVEIVKDGSTGFLVPTNAPSEVAKRIIDVKMGKVSREALASWKVKLEEEFSDAEMTRKHEELYSRLLKRKGWNIS